MPAGHKRHNHLMPFLAVAAGIASFSVMDGLMKSASLAIGAYSAMLWRSAAGVVLMAPAWKLRGGTMPQAALLRLHALRGANTAGMAVSFFYGITKLPLAEGIAISFIAPLIALYLAAILLGEWVARRAVLASLLGLSGVIVICAARLGEGGYDRDAVLGIAAILFSAALYAWNLILQRQQAQIADPVEIALFQAVFTGLALLPFAPWFGHLLPVAQWSAIALSAVLAMLSLMLIAWGYARAETQVLLPMEYTAFLWAAVTGWVMFGEALTPATVAGAVLIVVGCWIAARGHTEQTAL
ncbi:S-adenosylmethionine uptake transporter [Novosphingobium kunmingense]|uniref:S-adenosylmethionine uptake transporter n=1 Tax=Novosphingobium kunmingense TaxID=1211806 RepID=A0A2N0H7A3_9SPHN|nr:S-adenosylmethionine uptake transporter [Novosphingobium kunmingense]